MKKLAVFFLFWAVGFSYGNSLLEALNLYYPGLEKVKRHYERGEVHEACQALLSYYEERGLPEKLWPEPLLHEDSESKEALEGIVTFQGITARQAERSSGQLDWFDRGPNKDPEWAWFLNRHQHLRLLLQERAIKKINDQLIDWILSNPTPRRYRFSATWRPLEAARRIDAWLEIFFTLQKDPAFSEEARLLLLSSLRDHGDFLKKFHAFGGNHLLTEMTALATIALAWPEFKESKKWLQYAKEKVAEEIGKQVYPDGAHKELSNHYQRVVLQSLQRFINLCGEGEIENMWDYYAQVMRPDGRGPLNNDSDLEDNRSFLEKGNVFYNREDWSYLCSGGREGQEPDVPASRFYPWAGHAVMREHWGPDSQWAFFDMGPSGSAHQHRDQLHLSLSRGENSFLVDAGRYTYKPGRFREYFSGPLSHNVLILDGQGSVPPPNVAQKPFPITWQIERNWDFFSAEVRFAGNNWKGQGSAFHKRSIFYLRGRYWLVVDEVKTFGWHEVEVLWHFHPGCSVGVKGDEIYTEEGDFHMVGYAPFKWKMRKVRGLYSNRFNEKEESTAVSCKGVIRGPVVFVWAIWMGN